MDEFNRGQSRKFFQRFLTVAQPEEIRDLINDMARDSSTIESQIMDITWFVKSMTYDEAWQLSHAQREKWVTLINKRLKEESGDDTEYM